MKLTDEMFEQMLHEAAEKAAEMLERSLPDMDERQQHEFSPRFHRRMRRIMRRRKRSHSIRILKRAAVVILCIGLSVFGLSMTAEASRVEFFNFLTQIFSDRTEILYSRKQFNTGKFIPAEPTYLPDGLKEVSRNEEIEGLVRILYQSENGDGVDFQHELLGDAGVYMYDSEDANVENVKVKGYDATLVSEYMEGKMEYILFWTDWNSLYSIYSNLSSEEVMKVAESIQPINP